MNEKMELKNLSKELYASSHNFDKILAYSFPKAAVQIPQNGWLMINFMLCCVNSVA